MVAAVIAAGFCALDGWTQPLTARPRSTRQAAADPQRALSEVEQAATGVEQAVAGVTGAQSLHGWRSLSQRQAAAMGIQ